MLKNKTKELKEFMKSNGLRYSSETITEFIDEAEKDKLSYSSFMIKLLQNETKLKQDKKRIRNYSAAHFPPNVQAIEAFDISELDSGITSSEIEQLKDLLWIDSYTNLLFLGPPGLGKTMLAIALGAKAINSGYTVCFERMNSLIDILVNYKVSRRAQYRLKKIKSVDLLIVDEVGFLPISRVEANAFFTLISDIYEETSIIITSNKEITKWTELLGDDVLTTALLDRLYFVNRKYLKKALKIQFVSKDFPSFHHIDILYQSS